jgi:hypothetical protein
MSFKSTRHFALKLHIIIAIFQFFYIYTPLGQWEYATPLVRFVTFPMIVLTGIYLTKGHKWWGKFNTGNRNASKALQGQ